MSFMKQVVDESIGIWNECVKHPFLQQLSDGTLPEEKFKNYIIQDSIYLREYARCFAGAMYKSKNIADIKRYYSILAFVNESESCVRKKYLASWGLSDEDVDKMEQLAPNKAYTQFMLDVCEKYGDAHILMAVLPCMFSYYYIFKQLCDENPNIRQSRYWDMINDYTLDQYRDDCFDWGRFAEEKCSQCDEETKKQLIEIFKRSSEHELAFWNMANAD